MPPGAELKLSGFCATLVPSYAGLLGRCGGFGLQGLLLLSLLLFFVLWELLRNMFFAESLEFSEERAVKLRNAFSSREIPFGFSCFIICVQKKKKEEERKKKEIKTNPQHFALCCWSALRGKKGKKISRAHGKALTGQTAPLGAGLCSCLSVGLAQPDQRRRF